MSKLELPPKPQFSAREILEMHNSPEILRIIQRANEHYLYWDRFKYFIFPEGISAQQAWAYLKILRRGSQQPLLVKDKFGRNFSYAQTDSIMRYLSELDRGGGALLPLSEEDDLPSKEQFIISSLMEEAIASSQLEGAATTRRVAKEMLRSGRKPTSIHEQMIFNNWVTMQHIRGMGKSPLAPEDILEIQSLVTNKTLANPAQSGSLRKRDDIVVEYRGTIVHEPPGHSELPERLKALCAFANVDDKTPWIHPIIKASILHFWLAYDHPFEDGNGRTARALFYWYMLSRGYWIFQYLAVSRYFLRAPGQYTRAYQYSETDDNDLTYFIVYNLRAVHLAFQDVRRHIQNKLREFKASSTLLMKYRGFNSRQKALLYHALKHPDAEYTIETHRNYHGVAYDSARNDVLKLARKGFLEKSKKGKAFVFVPSKRLLERLGKTATP